MHLQIQRLRTLDPSSEQPLQIPHFLLGPHFDHLPWVMFRVPPGEAEVARNIAITIFEYQDGRFVDFDGKMGVFWVLAEGMVHVCFLSR